MPFLHPLNQTAPERDRKLRWPISGQAYVAGFMGPIAGGPLLGVLTAEWRAVAIGLPLGIGLAFLNGWFSDKFLDPIVAKLQMPLQRAGPRILANVVAFVWAILVSALAMLVPFIFLGSQLLARVR